MKNKMEIVFDKKYLTEILSAQIKEEWKRTEGSLPDFLPDMGGSRKADNEKSIEKITEAFQTQMERFPRLFGWFGRRKRWKLATEQLFRDIFWREPLLGIDKAMPKETLEDFRTQAMVFLKRVRAFDEKLDWEGMGQALRNYMVYSIFREINGLPQKCTAAIFGYSMLYPYTDNYIDNQEVSREDKRHYNKLIADKLSGDVYEVLSVYEKKTVQLLEAVEESYPQGNEIFYGLLLMLEAQRDSQKQTDVQQVLSEEEALDISLYKGGLSVLIDRYFVDEPMSSRDMLFYYGFGFLLQLCDDLQDISQDRKNGSRTVFSVCSSMEETEQKVNKLLRYTSKLFESCECRREEFKQFLLNNCYLLILFSAMGSKEHFSEQWLAWAESYLPVSQKYFESFKGGFSAASMEKESAKYMRMLDELVR